MNCQKHNNRIQYICTCPSCDYTALCTICRRQHLQNIKQIYSGQQQSAYKNGQSKNQLRNSHFDAKSQHLTYIVPLKKALETAQDNLRKQKKKIEDLIQPFKSQKHILQDVQLQKKKLKQQCQRIKNQIQRIFIQQMKQLQIRNRQIYNRGGQDIPLQDLFKKIQEIQQLQRTFKNNNRNLKKSIVYNLDKYLQALGRSKNILTSTKFLHSNQYYLYDDVKHDFFISKLELKRKNVGGKPLTKIYNQSPLYFLIDKQPKENHSSKLNYDDTLYFFSSDQKNLRLYNIKLKKWKTIAAPYQIKIPQFFCTVHDPKSDKFFIISGANSTSSKSTNIIWYDRKLNQWKQSSSQMKIGRSSAMCVLVKGSFDNPSDHKILIVGGLDNRSQTVKLTQLYDIQKDTIDSICDTNFGTSISSLINFNNIVFKIGGLGNYNREHAICQIAQKFDYNKYLQEKQRTKWTYIEFQDIFGYKGTEYKLFYAAQAGIQINPNEIFVFGGYDHKNFGVQQSYIIEVQTIKLDNSNKNNPKTHTRYYARWINQKKLLTGQGFPTMKPVIYQGKIYCLQNISVQGVYNNNQILQKEKKVLQFDMYQWSETQTFIDE